MIDWKNLRRQQAVCRHIGESAAPEVGVLLIVLLCFLAYKGV